MRDARCCTCCCLPPDCESPPAHASRLAGCWPSASWRSIATQTIINTGMTVGLMPVTGITLPLISHGGSSLLTTSLALGILLNVGMRPGYEMTADPFRFAAEPEAKAVVRAQDQQPIVRRQAGRRRFRRSWRAVVARERLAASSSARGVASCGASGTSLRRDCRESSASTPSPVFDETRGQPRRTSHVPGTGPFACTADRTCARRPSRPERPSAAAIIAGRRLLTSISTMARSACRAVRCAPVRSRPPRAARCLSRRPAVSENSIGHPSTAVVAVTTSRVVPG